MYLTFQFVCVFTFPSARLAYEPYGLGGSIPPGASFHVLPYKKFPSQLSTSMTFSFLPSLTLTLQVVFEPGQQ